MRPFKAIILCSSLLCTASAAPAQVFMDADNTGMAYPRITAKGYNYEVYDGLHLAGAPHIKEVWDAQLRKNVFAFFMHTKADGDPNDGTRTDRQRCEMKVDGHSPASMQIYLGDTQTNRWKFKLDAAFQPSSKFTHIHQIKPGTGTGWTDTENPIITFTCRRASPDRFEVNYIPPGVSSSNTILLTSVNLAPFKGAWVEAIERVTYNNTALNGQASRYDVTITNVATGAVLLQYSDASLELYRNMTIGYNRPKYGVYRSILDSTSLRDETVLFADFSTVKGAAIDLPAAPGDAAAIAVSGSRNDLTWSDNADNEDEYRIDRSADGAAWTYLAAVPANTTEYSDTSGIDASVSYAYRVRAENAHGNSAYSEVVRALPVEVTSLSAAARGLDVRIQWMTATETSSYGFEIERKAVSGTADAVWQKAGFVEGSGTTSSAHAYAFDDKNLEAGRYKYRLKQIDCDGTASYTAAVDVEVGMAPKEFRIVGAYPNPFNPASRIRFSFATEEEASLKIFNVAGQVVATLFEGTPTAGVLYERSFDAAGNASGVYFARLESGSQVQVQKLMLLK